MNFIDEIVVQNYLPERFDTYETHTAGEPTRIIHSGFPVVEASSILQKKMVLERDYDHFRSALMNEPRGHRDMVGAILTKAIDPNADLGVIYMDCNRWINMCGHATMGCAAVAIEFGLVEVVEPYTVIKFDTPAGLVSAKVKVAKGHAASVEIRNVPSFLLLRDIEVGVKTQKIKMDIAYGGSFFALIDSQEIGLSLEIEQIPALIDLGQKIIQQVNLTYQVAHPQLPIDGVANVEFYEKLENQEADQRNIVISAQGQVDRSPCGTGTSAKLAALYARKAIQIDQPFTNESILGTRFTGVVRQTEMIEENLTIVPEITGSAYIAGTATYFMDQQDPLKYGFQI